MRTSLITLDVRRQKPGERFLVETQNIVAELEVATPELGVALIASSLRKRRYHEAVPIIRLGRDFLGEPVKRITRMKAWDG